MRFFVAGAMYRARGALFSTIDTVAGEKPLCVATSRMVTAAFFPLGRFTGRASSAGIIILPESPNLQSLLHAQLLFRGHFKRQRFPEPSRLPDPEKNSHGHPDTPHDHRRSAKTSPQPKANEEPDHGRYEIPRFLVIRSNELP